MCQVFYALISNSVLVFLVFRQLTRTTWRSLIVASIFGLHPLRVESVAWISERKDVLCTLFWLLTLWAYARHAQGALHRLRETKPTAEVVSAPFLRQVIGRLSRFYFLALLFFALGLMSKPMMVTLPCALLLLDYWPLQRLNQQSLWGLLVEKFPFFLLSIFVSLVTCVTQRDAGLLNPVVTGEAASFGGRLVNALVSYGRYLGKLFWPANLCADYPYPDHWPDLTILLVGLLLTGVTISAFVLHRQRPYLSVGWLWYLGTLVPVLGLVSVGPQAMADRYSYIPSLGIVLMLVWGVHQLLPGWRSQSLVVGSGVGLLLLVCIVLTRQQLVFWQDEIRLWQRAVAVTERNYDAHNRLARALISAGRADEAVDEFREVIRLNPDFAEAYCSLGQILFRQGHIDEAIADYQKALAMQPASVVAHNNLANILFQQGRVDDAIREFEEIIKISPDFADAYNGLGQAFVQKGRLDAAIICYQKCLALNPDSVLAHNNFASILLRTGRWDEAIVQSKEVLALLPDNATAHDNLGFALLQKGQPAEALVEFQRAVELQPDNPSAGNNLGTTLLRSGRVDEATDCFRRALKFQPKSAELHNNLGYALLLKGRIDEAVLSFRSAVSLEPEGAEEHCGLGYALGKQGHVDEAIVELQKALQLRPDYPEASNHLAALLGSMGKQVKPN